jgi:uncharacterized protein (DUF2164 family)
MAITLSKDVKDKLIASIKRYFDEKLDEEIGDLKASLLLDFCVTEIGPTIYNQAISDAQTFMRDKVADIEGSCYQPEFSYWKTP